MKQELFRVVEQESGKVFRLFTDGSTDGFEPSAIIFNYFPALLAAASMSHASLCPTISDVSALGGAAQGTAS